MSQSDQARQPRGESVLVGGSRSADAETAAEEFHRAVWQPEMELAVFFCAPDYDLDALGAALRRLFGDAPVVGCTTAGEITPAGYRNGTLTGFSLAAPDFRVAIRALNDLQAFELSDGYDAARSACDELGRRGYPTHGDCGFGFLLVDGSSFREEAVAHALHAALEDIQLFGGSAGDGVELGQNPYVYANGIFARERALFMLIHTTRSFRLIKSENYLPTETKLVITEAEPDTRRVCEINGQRAAVEYAERVGVAEQDLNGLVFAAHPVGLIQGDEYYVRSIGWLGDDGALQFACAIDEGVVLSLARRGDFLGVLREALERARGEIGEFDLLIACDCVFRLFEMNETGIREEVSDLMRSHRAVGFNTYGEQINAMHVNQTLTAVAIGRAARGGNG